MALSVEINGIKYQYFTSATVNASVATVARGFSFVSTANEKNNFPIKIGDRVKVYADNIHILTGYVETLDISYDSTSHQIRVGGRSLLADFIDSTVPTQFEITGTTLQDIAKALFSQLGLSSKISNQAGSIRNFKDEITSAKIGQNALEFLESYSRKRQVLLTSAGDDTLILARSGTSYAPTSLKNVVNSNDNNILRARLGIDNTTRFYKYSVKSQLNLSIPGISVSAETASDQGAVVYDKTIRSTRHLEINAEESSDSFSAYDRALWEKNIRRGNSRQYSATISGNSFNGSLWLPNTLVRVKDDFAQVDSTMLIKDVEYNFDLYDGSTTTLTLINKKAFTLELEQSQREANAEKEGNEFLI